jgi:hypothetical protein
MPNSDHNARFFNYPNPTALEHPYRAPPPPNNPVIKGTVLHYLSNLYAQPKTSLINADNYSVAAVPFVQYLLWSNAGFGSLRSCKELENVNPRLDPTVIPISQPGDDAPSSYTNITSLQRALPNDGQPRFHTIEDIHNAYKSGALTPSDVVEALLPLIRRDVAKRGPHSTAFTESKVDIVRQAAEASTKRWKAGKPLGILDGVPSAVKDDLDVTGYKRHVGTSHDYTGGKEVETSWCVKKVEEEGAILVGKLNMHELGSGESSSLSRHGHQKVH